jgi:penicillin-binding protein 1A
MGFSPKLVVGVFVGFDDNRSLGEGETGAVAALPIFVEFMQDALKGEAPDDFTAPKDAKFAYVRGVREAFRPGTEPRVITASTGVGAPGPAGPQPYDKVWENGLTGAPSAAAAAGAPPPKTKKPAEDVTGLY